MCTTGELLQKALLTYFSKALGFHGSEDSWYDLLVMTPVYGFVDMYPISEKHTASILRVREDCNMVP
jgi:hypothetical protein